MSFGCPFRRYIQQPEKEIVAWPIRSEVAPVLLTSPLDIKRYSYFQVGSKTKNENVLAKGEDWI